MGQEGERVMVNEGGGGGGCMHLYFGVKIISCLELHVRRLDFGQK